MWRGDSGEGTISHVVRALCIGVAISGGHSGLHRRCTVPGVAAALSPAWRRHAAGLRAPLRGIQPNYVVIVSHTMAPASVVPGDHDFSLQEPLPAAGTRVRAPARAPGHTSTRVWAICAQQPVVASVCWASVM